MENNIYIKKANIYKSEIPLWLKTLLKAVFITFIICCAFVAVFNFIYSYTLVEGKSMYPTLNESYYSAGLQSEAVNDSVYINRFAKYKRGDLVVFINPGPNSQNRYVVKRLIAVGGDKIAIKNNGIYIERDGNVVRLLETYLPPNTRLEYVAEDFRQYRLQNEFRFKRIDDIIFGELYFLTLEEDEVFILGDNREAGGSSDSADYGPVKASKYVGRVDIIAYQSKNNASYIFTYFWNKLFG